MPIKRYEAVAFAKLSIPVSVGGKIKRVEFKGGTRQPYKKGGQFVTDNPALQEALERRADFNKKYKCIQTSLTRAEQEKENQAILDELKSEKPKEVAPKKEVIEKTEAEPEKKDDIRVIDSVTKYQEARNYLIKNFPDIKIGLIRSKTQVREYAEANGIDFPNWKD